jgi:phospho-N-acetylmuramoyl-pentapeptide-transferase
MTKAVLAIMIGFIASVIIGLIVIPMLKKKVKQVESTYLSKKHKEKSGTPTMGGIIFILSSLITMLILIILKKVTISTNLFLVLFVFLSYALIGFIDDYLIIKRKNNIGLTEIQKLSMQAVVALIFFYVYMHSGADAILDIHTLGITINMGWFYGIFILFMLVASSNAVNITDGLDGLAAGLSVLAYLAFALISWNTFAITGTEDIAIFIFVLVGSLIGFLVFNTHPAKVFMGDTGSLALGALVCGLAFSLKLPLYLPVIALIYFAEVLSVIMQVLYFKATKGKRIFKMTPIHHHFELSGWSEPKVVAVFATVTLVLGAFVLLFI